MTLILKLELGIVKMYHHTKNAVSMSIASKVIAQTDTHIHTHTQTNRQTCRHDKNITSTAYAGGNEQKRSQRNHTHLFDGNYVEWRYKRKKNW